MKQKRISEVLSLVLPVFFAGLLLAMTTSTVYAATVDVQVADFQFTPSTVTVQTGDTVRWTWGNSGHSVTSGSGCASNGLFDSGVRNTGFVFTFTFNTPGTFPYFCIPHCSIGMVGSVTVSAPPSGVNLLIDPTSVDFGNVTTGQTADRTITLTNGSNSTGTLTGTVGDPTGPFSVVSGSGAFSLMQGQSTSVVVRFTPPGAGPFNGVLEITHNATNPTGPTSIPLTGTGQGQPSAISLVINPTSINFGDVASGGHSDQTLTITNSPDSTGTLTGTVGSLTAPFSVNRGGGAFSLRPGRSRSVRVRFSPSASGVFTGTLEITHNAANQPNPAPVSLSGQGLPPDQLVDPIRQPIPKGNVTVRLTPVATGLVAPNWGTVVPGDSTRLFVVDQPGTLWAIDLTTGTKSVFGDFSALVIPLGIAGPGTYDERGFLGIAFHPQYPANGLLYTFTSEPVDGAADFSTLPTGTEPNCQSVIREWHVPAPTNPASVVDPGSSRVLLRIDKPQFNHNGGGLDFGPDMMLYVSLGDGGEADDQGVGHSPQGNGQDPSNVLGTILRINPAGSNSANGQYGIPTDNPFFPGGSGPFGGEQGCADGTCDEIFAYGFRNPFRFSFDLETGDLYVGDVGQNDIEEVDVVTAGGNYAWRIKEGSFCFEPNGDGPGFVIKSKSCAQPGLIDPVAQYDHDEGIAILAGFVYRGQAIRALQGRYVFGDYSRSFTGSGGRLFFLNSKNIVKNGSAKKSTIKEFELAGQDALNLFVLGFGQDASGELYVLGNSTGVPSGTTGVVLKISP